MGLDSELLLVVLVILGAVVGVDSDLWLVVLVILEKEFLGVFVGGGFGVDTGNKSSSRLIFSGVELSKVFA